MILRHLSKLYVVIILLICETKLISSLQPLRRHQGPPPITKSQVLAELEVTLAQKDRAYQLNPYDATAQNQVAVLHQVNICTLKY